MEPVAVVGLVVGMRHALEADHVAAVASMVAGGASAREAVRLGAVWGVGHAATLLAVGGVALVGGAQWPQTWSPLFESLVGLMLLALGADVLRRHLSEQTRSAPARRDPVPHGRALVVGVVHGLAGSAALMLLIASTTDSPGRGFLDLALFGIGSIGGMVLLSLTLSRSLHYANVRARAVCGGLIVIVGLTTAALGFCLVLQRSAQMSWPVTDQGRLSSMSSVPG